MSDPSPPDALNSNALAMLRRLGGQDLLSKMIGLFLERAPVQLQAARSAVQTCDLAALAQAVHALKSSAGQLGVTRVADLAQRIEADCEAGHSDAVSSLFEDLEAAYSAASGRLALERDAPGP